jgi:hypothetical protein
MSGERQQPQRAAPPVTAADAGARRSGALAESLVRKLQDGPMISEAWNGVPAPIATADDLFPAGGVMAKAIRDKDWSGT